MKELETAKKASEKFDSKKDGSDKEGKNSGEFATDLVNNFDDVIDVTKEAESLAKSDASMDSLLEDSQNAGDVKELIQVGCGNWSER